MHVAAKIGHDKYRPFTFFAKELGVGLGTSRGYAPVDIARIVTRLIRPRFIEFHPATFEMGNISARLQ